MEFHSFASLGEPERALMAYAEENARRAAFLRRHLASIASLTPFLEIGANAGHTSYLFENEFQADGFALDISADALRYGRVLQNEWNLTRAPVRVAGDAANLPFRDGSLSFVAAFQTLCEFMDIEEVFLEVKRVLAPGGVFLFAEEPLRRLLTLSLYRCPNCERMRPWEQRLYRWGLLGYLARGILGSEQETSYGLRLNSHMRLGDWQRLVESHFTAAEYEASVSDRGWGERVVKGLARRLQPWTKHWLPARLLGGSLAAVCRKPGVLETPLFDRTQFESRLCCPDCRGALSRDSQETLACRECGYEAPLQHGVYNLLRSAERSELYPGDREDILDFSLPSHADHLLEGWHELEGLHGNKFRWIGARATARLMRIRPGHLRLRVRGHAHERTFSLGQPVRIAASANGLFLGQKTLQRPGLFVFETNLPDAPEYKVEITASPTWKAPGDNRELTVNLSMIRLIPRED